MMKSLNVCHKTGIIYIRSYALIMFAGFNTGFRKIKVIIS